MTAAAVILGLVVAIADGDTLTVLSSDFQQVKVRLAEIDAMRSDSPSERARGSRLRLCATKSALKSLS